jgi:hypothetical protein
VDTATNCHLQYAPLGLTTSLADLDFIQPKFLEDSSASTVSPLLVTLMPDDNIPRPVTLTPEDDVDPISDFPPPEYSISLQDLDRDELIQWLYSLEHAPTSAKRKAGLAPVPLECMTQENIINKLHRPNSILPPVRPCNTPNPSDTKSHWTAEELHHITGCCCFRNYWHLVAASKDGTFIDTGEFPVSVGTYTTLPKASRGQPINRTTAKFLDVVHLDIAFGDCLSIGGFKYALIFVDQATRYNWCFGLKSLQSNDLRAVFLAFQAEAGSIA